ncbi:MAG: hypothetical protein II820_11370 [Ruminiclostridium sp.]|uniref:Uncharacterized protein n=1 Tax=uncultured bacterium Ad_136_J17_contig2 TaxID=1489302 RepID=A0A0B4N0V3_9BACT|nr:putative uncharacterized protein [uncultured bacterium Ad_136_J17_contig2]MBQ3843273.1 hypothetical protein [Ruminiclostridium sp.]
MEEKSVYRLRIFIAISSVLVFGALLLWLLLGLSRADSISAEQRLKAVKQSVTNGIVLCYSIEGCYPDSLEYIKDNYGVDYDDAKYLVHYRYVSGDIPPTVMVYENY